MQRLNLIRTQFTAMTFLVWTIIMFLVIFLGGSIVLTLISILIQIPSFDVSASTQNTVFWIVLIGYITAFVLYLLYMSRIKNRVQARAGRLAALSTARGWKFAPMVDGVQPFATASIMALGTHGEVVRNFVHGPNWLYGEYEYSVQQRFKSGEYTAYFVRYGIMAMKLPRELPHVVFDSVTVGGKQLGKQYDKRQLHTLEGDFSNYFNTYFAPSYTIDSLSFITPEVMIALRDAADYDIEIVGDQVLLYGPLFDEESQLADMSSKLQTIYDKLMNNITTYRDERLPYAEGRQSVAALGRSLRPKRIIYWSLIFNAIIFVVYWAYCFYQSAQ